MVLLEGIRHLVHRDHDQNKMMQKKLGYRGGPHPHMVY